MKQQLTVILSGALILTVASALAQTTTTRPTSWGLGGSTTQRMKLHRPRSDNPTSTERAAKHAKPDDP